MSELAIEILKVLELRPCGEGIFIAEPVRDGLERVFGGQLLAQALAAATESVREELLCHSLHAYFVRPGKPGRPIAYEVSTMRDAQRVATRRVVAIQREEVILDLMASFGLEERGAEVQEPMPVAPPPESFPPEEQRLARALELASPEQRRFLERRLPIEVIAVDERDPQESSSSLNPLRYWMRVRGALPRDVRAHRCALAYASDMGALRAAMHAGGIDLRDNTVQVASLDHALWLHRPFVFDDWLLFTFKAVSVAAGRGLSHGSVHTRDGKHVASLAQEGLMRRRTLMAL